MMFESIRAVTFDCWGTLIVDAEPQAAAAVRAAAVAEACGIDAETAGTLLFECWTRHVSEWQAGRQAGSVAMASWICEAHGIDGDVRPSLQRIFEEAALQTGVRAVDHGAAVLAELKRRGIATALICDTGFTPGRVVRDVLGSHGITLDALVFSDEIGVPKPDSRMFAAALDSIGGGPAVHIGDLRRTDVAGARAFGLGSVRFKGVYDDASDHPEADAVIDDLRDLLSFVGASPS